MQVRQLCGRTMQVVLAYHAASRIVKGNHEWTQDGDVGQCKVTLLWEWTMQTVQLDHVTGMIVGRNHREQCMVLAGHARARHCGNGQCGWCSCTMRLRRLREESIEDNAWC